MVVTQGRLDVTELEPQFIESKCACGGRLQVVIVESSLPATEGNQASNQPRRTIPHHEDPPRVNDSRWSDLSPILLLNLNM